ncbi:MAG: CHASE4 domain-containing protein, partial [Clostridiaceae bacterium]
TQKKGRILMKIRGKTLIIMIAFSFIFMTLFYSISYNYLMQDNKSRENKSIENRLNELTQGIKFETHNLEIIAGDWAAWNETYNFINNRNTDYEKSNLNQSTLLNLKINLFLLYNNDKQLIESKVMATDNKNYINISKDQAIDIEKYHSVFLNLNDLSDEASGLIIFNGRPMIISSKPVTNSILSKPKNGTLVMGRFLDDTMLLRLKNSFDSNISAITASSAQVSHTAAEGLKKDSYFISQARDNQISIYSLAKDPLGSTILYFKINQDRQLYFQGLNSLNLYLILLSISFFALFLLVLFLLNKNVIRPIESISGQVRGIVLDDYEKGIITVKGNDEFSVLAKDINGMLSKIHLFNKKIYENEERLKMVLDGSNSGYWEYNFENDILSPSNKIVEILGYIPEELGVISIEDLKKKIHKDDYNYVCSIFKKIHSGIVSNISLEYRILNKSNTYRWIYTQGNVVEYKSCGSPKRILGIVMDINHRKSIESEIKYLTYYDKLTGLFNRGYYEFNIERIE